MCGIAGYYGKGSQEILERMTRTLRHRGPDDEGFFVQAPVGLGQRRLSIIDLSPAGHQPMSNEDGSVWIVFNGEIYGFDELRDSLAQRHEFKSRTDTEVILHLYEEIGVEAFRKIHGMFAIAIYDSRNGRLILARDRMGKKPLYWSLSGNTLLFGSELKALAAHPDWSKRLDMASLDKYFLFGYVPTPHSIFKNTSKLEPSTWLSWDGGKLEKGQFWDINDSASRSEGIFPNSQFPIPNSQFPIPDFQYSIDHLDHLLNNAVRSRLVSDAPLGVFLSGGIDSSAVAYYAQKNSAAQIKTFSIGFREKSFDESGYARQVAARLGTDHHERIFGADDCLDLVPALADIADEPLADGSILPTCLLSGFTRSHVTVALGGDSGDELFYGYDTFIAHKLAGYYGLAPAVIRQKLIRPLAGALPTSFANISFDFKAKRFTAGFEGDPRHRDARWMSAFDDEDRAGLFAPEVRGQWPAANAYEDIDRYWRVWGDPDPASLPALSRLYLRMYMMDQVLVKVDRASMHRSLEVRAPFLDTSVVEFALSLPDDFKLRFFSGKYILKKLMAGRLPEEIIRRKKKGFGMPIGVWLRGPLKPLMEELLSPDRIKAQGLFNGDIIDKLKKEHLNGQKDNRMQIWPFMVFQLWLDRWKPNL